MRNYLFQKKLMTFSLSIQFFLKVNYVAPEKGKNRKIAGLKFWVIKHSIRVHFCNKFYQI